MHSISLFSGAGFFDKGLLDAGIIPMAQVEIDPDARGVLAHHFPDTIKFEDVRHVGKHNLPPAELMVGGFPCQDLSIAGRRKGFSGDRSSLWFEFHRVITEIWPRWVIIENVLGLFSSNGGRDFAIVLGGLTGILPDVPAKGWQSAGIARGLPSLYRVAWRVLDAQYFGLAQRRKRVFLVASLGDGRAAEVLFEREGSGRHPAPRRKTRQKAAADPGSGVAGTLCAHHRDSSAESADKLVLSTFGFQRSDQYDESEVAARIAARDNKGAKALVVSAIDVRNLRENGDISGTLQSKATGGYSLNYQNPIAFNVTFCDANGRRSDRPDGGLYVNETDHANTLTSTGKDKTLIASVGVRRLTPTECERLQGAPDDWTLYSNGKPQSDSKRYKQIGNAGAVPILTWIGRRILAVEQGD